MKIKIWICEWCLDPCVLPVSDLPQKKHANLCVFEDKKVNAFFEIKEVEAEDLLKYFAKPCKQYHLTQICNARGGICPKECDGDIEVCKKNVGIQRSIRVN